MKQIYLVNKSKAVLGLFSGVKSRITLTQPLLNHYCVLTVALMLLLGGFSTRVWGQSYQDSKWWSVYDTETHTGDAANIYGVTVCSYDDVFVPNAGTFSFDSKLPGKDHSSKQNSNSDPHAYEVEDYQIKIGDKTVDVTQNVSASSTRSGSGGFFNPYRWTFNYTYNYRFVEGSGMNSELTNIKVDYIYKLANASISIVPLVTCTVFVQNVKVPMAKHIRLVKEGATYGATSVSRSFDNQAWGTTSSAQTVNFRSFLTNGNITVKLTSGDKNVWRLGSNTNTTGEITSSKDGYTYKIGSNKFAYNGTGACNANDASVKGKASGYDFVVYFCPTAAQAYSGTITISDGKSSATVTLTGTGIKRNQTLQNFSTTAETHKTTDVVPAFAAYTTDNTSGANTKLTVVYSSDNTDVATVDNTGKVTIKKDGTVTFTASQAGNAYYNSCTSKSVTWNISKVTPTLIAPVISSPLKYNETCPVGAKVQNYWTAGTIAKDNEGTNVLSQNIEGTYSCEDLLLPAKNTEGYLVTFTPTNTDWYNTNTIRIYGEVAKGDQYIKWNLLDGKNPRDKYYEYATGEAFDATSFGTANKNPTGLIVNYSSSNPAFATIVDGNKLNVVKSNEVVTITATCEDPAGNWNDAVSVSKIFKTCGAKPDNWSVTASALTYGQLLSESELSGVVKLGEVGIDGTLEWVEPTTMPNAGPHNYTVLFTPENEDAFGSITFDVEVSVAKADPTITWNIGERLRENSRYSNFVTSSNTEKALNISVSNSSLLSVEGNVLTTGEVESAQNGWIKVSQPASANYNAVPEQTLNVTINPKSTVCLPLTLNETIYNNAKENSDGKVSWCSTNENGSKEDYILGYDVTYTQREGIALGSWDEGLNGLTFTKVLDLIRGEGSFSWSSKSVDLSFTGVPDRISFDVESQKVTSTWPEVTWKASATDWYLYESADGLNYTQVGEKFVSGHQVRNRQLQPTTRYIRIKYSGNFTGFVKNLQITRKKYLNVDKPSLTFGTEVNPLQEPQTITLSYASLGYCGDQNSKITVTSSNPAFYVDETEITENVDIDQMGEYTIRVRCNDVNQEGTLTIEANDGTSTTVNVHSTKPDLTTAHTETFIFQTGTEHAVSEGSAYRTQQTHNFTACFNGGPVFDTLYIYGVTESSSASRLWEMDALKGYKVPALNVAEGNVHTPCFVYAKSGTQYEYIRTFDAAAGSLDIEAAGKKLGFIGYKPVNETVATPAIRVSGGAEIYLNNAEMVSKGSVMVLNGANTVHARGNNTCSSANAAAIQLGSSASALTIEDSWAGDATPGKLVLKPAAGKPSIDLNGANNVTINGTQLELHNAVKMAIAHMDGETEKTDGSVKINDGTIVGESTLGLPQNTLIDGGTFNDGTIVCYNHRGKTVRPFNSRGEVLARAEKEKAELPDWYGKAHLTEVAGRVYPMLYGGEGLCIFENTKEDHNAQNELNWTENPVATSDAIIAKDMEVNGSLTINSMTINEGVTVTVKNGATLIVGDGDSFRETAGNLHVENGGKVQLTTGELIVKDFILDAELGITEMNSTSASASGQVANENKLRAYGDAYFRLKLDPSGRNTLGWYDFVVPFEVDVIGGISIAEDPDAQMKFNVNYAVMSYSESKRAVNGKDWNKFQGTMQPGRVYTIGLDDDYDWNTVVFKKKAGAALTGNRSFTTEYSGLGADVDNGWNGFGNGTLHHTELDVPDGTLIQLYDHSNRCYQPREAKDYTIAVGLSFFMQFDGVETVELANAEGNSQFRAPAHYARTTDKFRLALTAEGEEFADDNMWVSANEDATGEYVIGRDVLKMGTMNESKVARMWSERNGIRLCSNEMVLNNSYAVCDLTLYAPKAQQYTLSVEKAPEDAMLYLTYEGRAIWNLSYSPYVFDLAKGTTEGYGLKLYANPAPQVATGVDDLDAEAQTMRKVMIDNVLYIITPDGAMYDVTGKSVK